LKPLAPPRRKADLHLHSTRSDGLWPPERVVEKAARAGVTVMALTDHDSTEGLEEAGRAASRLGLELIPGAEISVDVGTSGERHVLAYGIDPADGELRRAFAENVAARTDRLHRMIEALARDGVRLSAEEVLAETHGNTNVGRPHVADALVRKGVVRRRQEAFDRWLGDGRNAHVPKINLQADRAIRVIHGAGGVAVLAHPGRRWDPAQIEALVREGLDGLEAFHPSNGTAHVKALQQMAERWSLIVTGGSDCHGDEEGESNLRSGAVPVSCAEAVLHRVATRAASRRAPAPAGGPA
jgi:3',5'-nucleoside bisphosphate phosphatase